MQILLKKLLQALKSRTFWTIVVTFLVNGISAVRNFLPAYALPVVDVVLMVATVYFHIYPKQNFNS